MDSNIAGKTALVKGASRGIGNATAVSLASEGVTVIAVSRSFLNSHNNPYIFTF
jgi:NAD(P)-dependent dehydrogenase (short-subunit alcohol dehydrogenase family)